MADFETLQNFWSFGSETSVTFDELGADYGDGYADYALIGSQQGTLSFALKYTALPGGTAGRMYDDGINGPTSRADYLWNFFVRHKAQGNKPFRIISDRDGQPYLVRFAESTLSYTMFMWRLYSTGVKLNQARLRGVEDGSDPLASPNPDSL